MCGPVLNPVSGNWKPIQPAFQIGRSYALKLLRLTLRRGSWLRLWLSESRCSSTAMAPCCLCRPRYRGGEKLPHMTTRVCQRQLATHSAQHSTQDNIFMECNLFESYLSRTAFRLRLPIKSPGRRHFPPNQGQTSGSETLSNIHVANKNSDLPCVFMDELPH